MDSKASGRLALFFAAATLMLAAVTTGPAAACGLEQCPSDNTNLQGVAANALPTYPEKAAETAAEPVKLKKFTRQSSRSARRSQPRKAQLAQRARAGKLAAARRDDEQDTDARPAGASKSGPAFANANAQLVDAAPGASGSASPFGPPPAAEPPRPAPGETPAIDRQAPGVELVSADEFNDLDRAAWEANQMPKLMQLRTSDSRAELRDDDSRWAQTSMIGKFFVAFGALLTLGSAIRMFLA